MVVKVMIGVWVMVQNALIALDKNELDPSFLRYFARNNIWTVQPVLRSILVTMGMPDFEEERQCLGTIPKLEIWYGSAPSGVDRCDRPLDMQPLGFRHSYKDQNGQWREYVMFCDAYYRTYRSYDDVKCTELGTDSTPIGFSNGIWSASMVTLHELLHWKALTKAAADGLDIRDQIITRPDNGEQTKCYDPFYSKALMDWNTKIPPTTNIDNYVSFVTEAFYTFLCPNKEPWKDPVDPKDVFPVSSEQ
ncbi:hypothetical protein PMZ80_002493 [Knufia obscura]|uniref:Lysine-specific metallo-endopeptidase domain-containing protein n=1 Tax=Knufia obscura TaxID=1635080 RepID=A0ABR0RYE5_9EURO|nr:hypothetical protein PMZ80_002493 [Knufia obscura]